MKNIFYKFLSFKLYGLLVIVLFSSCEKHDFFDENLITGKVGPQAYWEIESTTMSAGSDMSFVLQYYSTVSDITHTELWYNVTETQEKTVTCPWVTSFTYSYTSTQSEEKRVSQKVQEYPHSLAAWSDTLRAYTFTSDFTVSRTLAPLSWMKPEQFDSTKMETYFGADFMQQFKDSLYDLMKYADFKNMILGLSLLEDFKQYTDSTFDINSDSYVYHFPKDEQGNTPVPEVIKGLYDGIAFDHLIEGTSGYNVEYKRTYYIQALLRVYDKQGVYGTTILKKIDIN